LAVTSFCTSASFAFWSTVSRSTSARKGGNSSPGRTAGGPIGPPGPALGIAYFHTVSLSGVTSNTAPALPEQISVSPLGSRWAPEIVIEKKLPLSGAE